MNLVRRLFIGGPWDGRIETVQDIPHLKVEGVREGSWLYEHAYEVQRFACNKREWRYLVSIELTPEEAIDRLMSNYKPKP